MPERTCRRCGERKPFSRFKPDKNCIDGYRRTCNDCNNVRYRERWAQNHNGIRDKQLARARAYEYGATPERIAVFLDAQEYACPICKTPIGSEATDFHVDHDHDTGRMRGLLCNRCNRGLGLFGDGEDGLLAALVYLTKPPLGLDMARKEVDI